LYNFYFRYILGKRDGDAKKQNRQNTREYYDYCQIYNIRLEVTTIITRVESQWDMYSIDHILVGHPLAKVIR
jgi:hypothetical protein